MNETLEAMARALFKSWFVDFDPTRAKAEGRQPAHMDADTAALFPNTFGDEGLPLEWSSGELGDLISIFDSLRIPLSSRERTKRPGPYPYYGATSVMDYVDDFLFEGVHLLVGEDGSVIHEDGKPFLQYVWGKFWVNNHAHVLRGKNGASTECIYCLLQQANISAFVTGAVQPKLNQKNLKSIPIILPSAAAFTAFDRKIKDIFSQVRHNNEENRTLTELRDTLLPKLMSGEIRVRDAEKEVEAIE